MIQGFVYIWDNLITPLHMHLFLFQKYHVPLMYRNSMDYSDVNANATKKQTNFTSVPLNIKMAMSFHIAVRHTYLGGLLSLNGKIRKRFVILKIMRTELHSSRKDFTRRHGAGLQEKPNEIQNYYLGQSRQKTLFEGLKIWNMLTIPRDTY